MAGDPTMRLALDNEPALAQQVGLLLSAFAIIELFPSRLLVKVTGMQQPDAEIALGHFRNLSNRLDLIDAIAATRGPTDQTAINVRAFIAQIRTCNILRNKYAHSLWTQESNGDRSWWRLTSWLTDSTRDTKSTFVTVASIKADCASLRETVDALSAYAPLALPPLQPQEPPP